MKDEVRRTITNPLSVTLRHLLPVMVALAVGMAGRSLALADDGGQGGNDGDQQDGNNGNLGPLGEDHQGITYEQINLVADLPGVAMLQDTNLVNAWGISFGPKTPFWISDNGTGLSTLYSVTNDMMGMPHVTKVGLEVSIPGDGTPTGQLFNNTTAFHTNLFIFASEDGTISGWRQALGTAAEILVSATNTVYKGITLVSNAMGPMLLAANFAQAKIDVYDTNMNLTQFSDDNAPDGYAPFNVENLGGMVLVTFAKQDDAKHDDVPGFGNGLIDVFDPMTHMFQRLVTGTDAGGNNRAINSPWGMTISPKGFGDGEEHLLVGNFGSGTIMSFDDHGQFEGLLRDTSHKTLVIDGLWGLTTGNGTKAGVQNGLYFTAGPDGESHGLFGNLVPVRPREHARQHRHGHR